MSERQITGRQVFAVTASAFAVIIAVNLTMAMQAVSTFPGVETKNSYVASQSFEARRDAQEALGWNVTVDYAGGAVVVQFSDRAGRPVNPEGVSLLIGRKTSAAEDRRPALAYRGGGFVAEADLAEGFWTVRLRARAADGTPFEKRLSLYVSE